MTSSATQDFLSDVVLRRGARIPAAKLAYFQTRLAGSVHQAMLKVYGRLEDEGNFTRRDLAHRIGRKPEQITRWFSYPGNLTLSTVSDIFVGMGYEVESITLVNLGTGKRVQCPDHYIDWIRLAGLYEREDEPQSPPPEPRQRTALGDQLAHSQASSEPLAVQQGKKHSALFGLMPKSAPVQRSVDPTLFCNFQSKMGQEA